MVTTFVRFRSPFPPHEEVVQSRPANISYGFAIMERGTGSFRIPRSDPNIASFGGSMSLGAFVTIERSDGLFPWAGYVTRRRASDVEPDVEFTCQDVASALLGRTRTRIDSTPMQGASGDIINTLFREAAARAEPPLMLSLDIEAGPATNYTPKADNFLDFLDEMASVTGWEWYIRTEIVGGVVDNTLVWRGPIGEDVRNEAVWESSADSSGSSFERIEYVQDAEGYIGTSLVIGGEGDFAARTAVAVSQTGRGTDRDVQQRFIGTTEDEPPSPALAGTEVALIRSVTDVDALFEYAAGLHKSPKNIREHFSGTLVESRIDLDFVGVGNIVTIRLDGVDLGSSLTRIVRVRGLQFNADDGTIEVECEALRQEQ